MRERQAKRIAKKLGPQFARLRFNFSFDDFDEMDENLWEVVRPLYEQTFTEANMRAQLFPFYQISAQTGEEFNVTMDALTEPLLKEFNEKFNSNPLLRVMFISELIDCYVEKYGERKAVKLLKKRCAGKE